jgi:hypothetical protein
VTKKDEIEQSLENEIERIDETVDGIRDLNELVPGLQERRKEAVAKLTFVKYTPDAVFSEFEDNFYDIQKSDEEQAKRYVIPVPEITPEMARYWSSGTASTSSFYEVHSTVANFDNLLEVGGHEWAKPITDAFSELADEKAKKAELPAKLDSIQEDLGKMFTIAQKNVEKAKSGIVGVDQSAKQLRDVIQQLWGGLADLARKRGPAKYKRRRLALKKIADRNIVVQCLADNEINAKKLTMLLSSMAKLHLDLSVGEFMKNPLTDDIERLESLYRRWILVIDDVVSYIHWNMALGE